MINKHALLAFFISAIVIIIAGILVFIFVLDRTEKPLGEWQLIEMTSEGQPVDLIFGRQVILTIQKDLKISGNASCNTFFGQVKYTAENQIEFTEIGATEMFCPDEGVMAQETQVFSGLNQVRNYAIDENILLLSSPDRQTVLRFILLTQ